MTVVENKQFSKDYLDPDKRSIANAVQIRFKDGTETRQVVREYPIGHRFRRQEGLPKLIQKYENNLATRFPNKQLKQILDVSLDQNVLEETFVHEFVNLFVI